MNYILPYKMTINNILKNYYSTSFQYNKLFDKHYMIKKVFKELLTYLQIDEYKQKQELQKIIDKYNDNIKIYNWMAKELNVLIGSLYEQEIASILYSYQLTPEFTNTFDNVINFTEYNKMKMPDILVQSINDESYHAFDIKSGMVWRKKLDDRIEQSPIWIYNTGLTAKKLNELYFSFKYKMERQLKQPVHMYLILVCFDMLTKINYENQAEFYQLAFNDIPNHIEKVCFVIDIEKLFIIDNSFDDDDKILDTQSEYLLKLENEVEYDNVKAIYKDKYAIRVDSPISMTLKDFINQQLI